MPEFSSTFHNGAAIDPKDIEISAEYSCHYFIISMGSTIKGCGRTMVTGKLSQLNSEGTLLKVTFPQKKVKSGKVPLFYRNTIDFSGRIVLKIKGKEFSTPESMAFYRNDISNNKSIQEFITRVKDLTFVSLPETKIRFVLPNGEDAIDEIVGRFDAKDSLRILLESDFDQHMSYKAVAITPEAFGGNIHEATYPAYQFLLIGYTSESTISFSRIVRIEPVDWRNNDWGHSWKILGEEKLNLKIKDLQKNYPSELKEILVDENWVK